MHGKASKSCEVFSQLLFIRETAEQNFEIVTPRTSYEQNGSASQVGLITKSVMLSIITCNNYNGLQMFRENMTLHMEYGRPK